MIEHVCEWSKDISFNSIDVYPEHTATHHHSCPAKVPKPKSAELFRYLADLIVVPFQVKHLFMNEEEKGRTYKLS